MFGTYATQTAPYALRHCGLLLLKCDSGGVGDSGGCVLVTLLELFNSSFSCFPNELRGMRRPESGEDPRTPFNMAGGREFRYSGLNRPWWLPGGP